MTVTAEAAEVCSELFKDWQDLYEVPMDLEFAVDPKGDVESLALRLDDVLKLSHIQHTGNTKLNTLLRMDVTYASTKTVTEPANAKLLWDTGAGADFVKSLLLSDLANYEVEVLDTPLEIGLAAEFVIQCKSRVRLVLDLAGVRHVGWFYVLDNLAEDLIFGCDTFLSYHAYIDLESRTFLGALHPVALDGYSPDWLLLVMNAKQRDDSPFVEILDEESDFQTTEALRSMEALGAKNSEEFNKMMRLVSDPGLKALLKKYEPQFTEEFVAGMIPPTRGKDDCEIVVTQPDTTALKAQFPLSEEQEAEADRQVDTLWHATIIEPSDCTLYAAPVLFVRKKDGTWRMCIDYRNVNPIIANHQCVVPVLEQLVAKVVGKKYISTVDLTSAFHQQRIRPECRDITTFIVNGRRWRFVLLPFGLKVSPAIMQMTIARLIEGIPGVYNYIDDIVIASDTLEEHRAQIEQVLQRFADEGFYLKASKCEFLRDAVTFLGYKVLSQGMEIPDNRKEVFALMMPPLTRKMMLLVLGLFTFFRQFVRNYAVLAKPLQRFAASTEKVLAKELADIKEPFLKLRDAMVHSAKLLPVLEGHPFEMEVDASAHAVGAVLFQRVNGRKHGPVAILLKSLNLHQEFYPVRQKELLAIVYAVQKWRHIVRGHRIDVYSDHLSLQYLLRTARRPEAQRVANWIDILQNYDVVIHYKPGESNEIADFLSRQLLPVMKSISELDARKRLQLKVAEVRAQLGLNESSSLLLELIANPTSEVLKEIQQDYETDAFCKKTIRRLRSAVSDNRTSKKSQRLQRSYSLINGLLVKGGRIVISAQLAKKWIKQIHERSHRGVQAVWHELQPYFVFRESLQLTEEVIRSCEICQRRKLSRLSWQPLQPLPIPTRPFQVVHMDEVTALPLTRDGYYGIFTIVDSFSKFAILIPIKHGLRELEVATLLVDHVFSVFGHPKVMVSDKANNFLSKTVKYLKEYYNIETKTTSTNHPETNGLVERVQQTIVTMLRCMCDRLKVNWPSLVKVAQMEYNRTWTRLLNMPPYKAVFGVDPPPFKDIVPERMACPISEYLESIALVRETVQEKLQEAQLNMEDAYNRKHQVAERQFKVGDWVLVSKDAWYSNTQKNWKFYDWYYGPFRIVGIPHKDNPTVVKVDLKPWHVPTDDELMRNPVRTINTKYLKPYVLDHDIWRSVMTQTPFNKEEFLRRWTRMIGIAYIDVKDKAIGVQYRGAQPGHVARIPFEWFCCLDRHAAWQMVKEFLNKIGSTVQGAPKTIESIFGRTSFEEELLQATKALRERDEVYRDGLLAPREPIRFVDAEGYLVDTPVIDLPEKQVSLASGTRSDDRGEETRETPQPADQNVVATGSAHDHGGSVAAPSRSVLDQQHKEPRRKSPRLLKNLGGRLTGNRSSQGKSLHPRVTRLAGKGTKRLPLILDQPKAVRRSR